MGAVGLKALRADTHDDPKSPASGAPVTQLDVQQAVERNFARIYRAALVMTGNPWDADDLAQGTFLIVARDAANFKRRSRMYTWIYGILLNVERGVRRRHGMHRRKLEELRANRFPSETVAPAVETATESEEWKRSLWAQVSKLPETQRQTLVLRFCEGLR